MAVLAAMVARFTRQVLLHSPLRRLPAARPAPAAQVVKALPFVMAAMAAPAAVVAQFTRKILLRSGPLSLMAARLAPAAPAAQEGLRPTMAPAGGPATGVGSPLVLQ